MNAVFAAAYLRRSSVSGDSPGDASREAQEVAVRRLCGPDVVLYVDWGISGRSAEKRPDYMRLKADIAAGRVGSVCAYSLSRLGRNARELLAFIELAQAHDVPVRTAVEAVDTSTAMGRAMLTVMAAFAQLELEQGMERTAAARAARQARHDEAGVPMPPSNPIYGKRHVTVDGITRVVDDPARPIEPVLAAYRAERSIRKTCARLQAEGIPAPAGGKVWNISTTRRLLMAYAADGLIDLPPARGKDGHRRPVSTPALFAGLLRCQCGRTMTPNTNRKDKSTGKRLPVQYFCAAGAIAGVKAHGHYTAAETILRPILEAQERRYQRQAIVRFNASQASGKERERLEKRRDVYLGQEADGLITGAKCRQLVAEVDAKIADMDRQARGVLVMYQEDRPTWDEPIDVAAMNKHLRRLWRQVQLDENMAPILPLDWNVPAMLYDEEAAAAADARAYGPDEAEA